MAGAKSADRVERKLHPTSIWHGSICQETRAKILRQTEKLGRSKTEGGANRGRSWCRTTHSRGAAVAGRKSAGELENHGRRRWPARFQC
jgi:hypothetical protein